MESRLECKSRPCPVVACGVYGFNSDILLSGVVVVKKFVTELSVLNLSF